MCRLLGATAVLGLAAFVVGCSESTGPDQEDVLLEEAAPGPDNLTDGAWEARGSGLQEGLFRWVTEPFIEIRQTREQVDPVKDVELLQWLPNEGLVPDEFRLVFQVRTSGSGPAAVEVLNGVPTALAQDDIRASMTGMMGFDRWTEFELAGTVPDDSQGLTVRLQMNGGLQFSTASFRSLWLETF